MFVPNSSKIPLYQQVFINLNSLTGATNMGNLNLKDALSLLPKITIFNAFFFQKDFFTDTQLK